MSKKSTVTANLIAQPQGGGALKGIGEKFTPDLQTGTGNFTIPLEFLPGRNGFQPDTNLVYSTGYGNGAWGLGWSLNIPAICRQTAQGIPTYVDTTDHFILSGAEELVPVAQTATVKRYRPRTEGLFARIEHHTPAGSNFWKVWSKEGVISFFGTPRPVHAAPDWEDPAVIADPANRAHIFCWQLAQTVDTFGNRIQYHYVRDLAAVGPRHFDQLYLDTIHYVDYTDEQGETQFLVSLKFEYQARPDPFSSYRAGFEIRTRHRCKRLTLRTHAGMDRPVRSYEWTYLDERTDLPDLPTQLPHNAVSLLSRHQIIGHNDAQGEMMPPLELAYTPFRLNRHNLKPVAGAELPAQALNQPHMEMIDLFGNGLPDMIEMNGTVRYWRNLGNGKFARPRAMAAAPAGVHLGDPGVQLLDANADGRMDLLVTRDGLAGYYPLQSEGPHFEGGFDARSFQPYAFAPTINLQQPDVKLLDLNGDGVIDALRANGAFECYFNDAQAGWVSVRHVSRRPLAEFPNVAFDDPHIKLADMSGDGLQDIVRVHDGNVEYWPNKGYGNWGKRVSMSNNPRFPFGYNPQRILLGDVDGDGLADLIYVDDHKVTLYINQAGNGWSEPIEITGTPRVTDLDAIRLVDLHGNGTAGLLWSTETALNQRHHTYFLDFINGSKPYLLQEINNHRGAVTRIGYAPSTQFYLADAGRPETRWRTSLPFPVQVVATTEIIDQLSGGKLSTTYRYHHGYWDGVEREFRGFGMVEQQDSESFDAYHTPGLHGAGQPFAPVDGRHFSAPTLTKTWFHLGPISDGKQDWVELDYGSEYWAGDPRVFDRSQEESDRLRSLSRAARRDALRALRGSVLRTEVYALDASSLQKKPYTVAEFHYGLREETPPADNQRLRIIFPHLLAERTTQWERGDDPMTAFNFTSDYDAYGHPQATLNVAVPRGRNYQVNDANATEHYPAIYTTTVYTHRDEADVYIGGRQVSTTHYEIINDGTAALSELVDSIYSGAAPRQLIDHMVNFFDGPAYTGLPFGQLGAHGALTRTEILVLTEAILNEAYGADGLPYLNPEQPPAWTSDYPLSFRNQLLPLAGYIFQPGAVGSAYERGYYAVTAQYRYDEHGLLLASRDAAGEETAVVYDAYHLLPTTVTDPAGLTTQAEYDYRLLQAHQITDANGNREQYTFTPLGLPASMATMGKVGEAVGDTSAAPSTHWKHDLLAFTERGQPVSLCTIQRNHHVNDTDVPLPERDKTIKAIHYSDGFGRPLQTRSQTDEIIFGDSTFADAGLSPEQSDPIEPAVGIIRNDHVLVSGWQIYNNKGQVIEKYASFFAAGWDYNAPSEAQMGAKDTFFYDPRNRIIRTQHTDGSEELSVFGIPTDLTNPSQYIPTPWESYSYDANDNAQRTHGRGLPAHWHTPTSNLVDALGRVIAVTDRNGPDPLKDWYTTHYTYDIRGNLLAATDPLGRVAIQHIYDLRDQALRTEQLDNGVQLSLFDARGVEIEARDSKGSLLLHSYDALVRLTSTWARDNSQEAVTLRAHLIYGDSFEAGFTFNDAQQANLLGRLYQEYDEVGRVTSEVYDFKGNALEVERQVISDQAILDVFSKADDAQVIWQIQPFRVDWQPPANVSLADHALTLLDTTSYCTSTRYDALGRIKTLTYPEDEDGQRKIAFPTYNQGGNLRRLVLDETIFINHIAYNARGQRILLAYGNRVMTRYAYNHQTFQLARMRSEQYTQPAPHSFEPSGAPFQDLGYVYDLVGNITTIQDRTPEGGIPNTPLGTDALDRFFTYDPIYRLLSATGRECDVPAAFPWDTQPRGTDLTRTRGYSETYQYDAAGNLTHLSHQHNSGGFARQFTHLPGSNRLDKVTSGTDSLTYHYDVNGNLLQETTARYFEWDHSDQLKAFRNQAGSAEPSVYAHYLYDANGQRVKKLVRKRGGSIVVTVYINGIFEHHYSLQNGTLHAYNTLHVMDEGGRIAEVRIGRPASGDATPAVKYQLGDHLGSSNIVVSATGQLINREEYTPYGETSFGSFAFKRYRYTGKECDNESGLYYHGARYYAPWLARWISCDPAGTVDGLNLYTYVGNAPMTAVDPTGTQSEGPLTPKLGWWQKVTRSIAGKVVASGLEVVFQLADLTDDPEDPLKKAARAGEDVEALNRDKARPGEIGSPPDDNKSPTPERKDSATPKKSKHQKRAERREKRRRKRNGKGAAAPTSAKAKLHPSSSSSPRVNAAPSTKGPTATKSTPTTKPGAPAPKPPASRLSGLGRLAAASKIPGFLGFVASIFSDMQDIVAEKSPEWLPEGSVTPLNRVDPQMPFIKRPTGFYVGNQDGEVIYYKKVDGKLVPTTKERALNVMRLSYGGEA